MKSIYTCFCTLILYTAHAQGYCADNMVYLTEHHTIAFDDVVYKQAPAIDEWFAEIPENIRLRVYYPDDLPPGTQRPLVVLIHGGFFIAGSYQDFNAFAENLAELGFVAATLDYRLCKRNDCLLANVFSPCNVSWSQSFIPSAYVAAVDVNDGIRWLQQHAEDYFINPEKVIVSGHSAGAFTALNVAFLDQLEIQQVLSGAGLPGHDYYSEPLDPVEGIQAVIPMAGAMLKPEWIGTQEINDRQIAVGIVHGTADGVVGYDAEAAIPCCNTFQTVVHGGCAIAARVQELGGNLFILSGDGFGHDVGDGLFLEAISEQIPAFIIKTVICGEDISLHAVVERNPALDVCPNGSGEAAEVCDVLPIAPGGIVVPVAERPDNPLPTIIQIAPSPITGNMASVELTAPSEGDYQYIIQDFTGKTLLRQTIHLPAGKHPFQINTPFPPGIYTLQVTGRNSRFKPVKILKM